jgi:hypothetical protein
MRGDRLKHFQIQSAKGTLRPPPTEAPTRLTQWGWEKVPSDAKSEFRRAGDSVKNQGVIIQKVVFISVWGLPCTKSSVRWSVKQPD